MSYQHLNRLKAHWLENPNSEKLSPAQKLVALVIAAAINKKTNHYHLSAETISKQTLLSTGAIDKATPKLESLGFFSVSRAGMRSPKDFRLLVECPETCQARPQDHYTASELRERELTKADNSTLDKNESPILSGTESPILEAEFPILEAEFPILSGTNKELIKINKENINKEKELDFYLLVISNALKELALSQEYTKDHELLQSALEGNRVEVLERAREITGTATNPEPYLTQITKTSPNSLLKRTSEQVHKAKYPRNLKSQYEAYREHTPELMNWNLLLPSQVSFLERTTGETLSITSATAASEATNKGINLDSAKSLSEALELITKPEQDLDLAVAALARSREFLKRHS
jgi:hypothetical protein